MTDREAKKRIRAIEKTREGINCTRWYTSVHPTRNGEANVKTWAVKTWKGKPIILLASIYPTNGSQPQVSGRCLTSMWDNCPHFNWLDYGGKSHVAVWSDVDSARDEMLEAYKHEFRRGIEFYGLGTFVNGFEGTKYAYGQYANSGMRVSDWLDCMHISPKTELLIKANLHRWLDPRYLPTLLDNKELLNYVRANAATIETISPYYVIRAFRKTGKQVNDERAIAYTLAKKYDFGSLAIKPLRIVRWLNKHKVKPSALRHHIDNLIELNMNTAYEPHVLPKDWQVYSLHIEERVHERREAIRLAKEAEEMEKARIAREARIFARRTIRQLLAEGKISKKYTIVVPATETEMVAEGNAMHNCIGGYWHRTDYQRGEIEVAFIHKNGKPYIDLEIRDGRITQARYSHNKAVEETNRDYRICETVAKAFVKSA